ncbi:MAG TPA: ABC transporter permease [Terracidiphilus sp.]|jgi:predicted permease
MLIHDLRFAFRQLRKSPGFALTVVFTLALSVGVATAVFCVIDAVILRPLPYAHPERIMAIETRSQSGYTQPASWPSYKDERQQAHAFAALAGFNDFFEATMETPSSGPVLLHTVHSTGNFFQVFGVQPLLGRTYVAGEEQDGKNQVVVLSYEIWQTYFGGDRNAIGKAVKLDGLQYTVIGVMPAGFRYPVSSRNIIYTPRLIDHGWMQSRGTHWMRTIARLKDGENITQAQADLGQVVTNIGRAYPESDGGRTVKLIPLAENVTAQSRGPLWTLLGAVIAILGIGCVNIAGLLLARGVKREREMAMRVAVGAARMRLLRQVLTEGILIALAGAGAAVLIASTMLSVMRTFLIKALARGADIHMNWTVLAVGTGVAVLVSLAASLYPALRMSGADPNKALKAGGSAGTERAQHHVRSAFTITQVALTLVLLVVAGMLMRVVTRYRHVDLGFDPAHILTMQLNITPSRYAGRDVLVDFYRPLAERVRHIPGVRAVGIISSLPIENWGSNSDIHIAGQPPNPPKEIRLSEVRFVDTGYFDVFGIPMRSGRMLSPTLDKSDGVPMVVVNDAFVKKFIPPGLDPTVQKIDSDPDPKDWTHIAGVVGNVRQNIYADPLPEHDYLIDALPAKDHADILNGMDLVVRFNGDAAPIVSALRNALHESDATVPFKEARTMAEVVSETLVFERLESWLFGIFASMALLLALVGLYGLISHEVELGTRDIGVRMALGASRPRILGMVMRRVTWMVGAGAVTGLVLTLLAQKIIDMVIYLDAGKESGNLLGTAVLLVAAGMLAALIPARRAASIQPMQALRSE